jgi:hypothetical protein
MFYLLLIRISAKIWKKASGCDVCPYAYKIFFAYEMMQGKLEKELLSDVFGILSTS